MSTPNWNNHAVEITPEDGTVFRFHLMTDDGPPLPAKSLGFWLHPSACGGACLVEPYHLGGLDEKHRELDSFDRGKQHTLAAVAVGAAEAEGKIIPPDTRFFFLNPNGTVFELDAHTVWDLARFRVKDEAARSRSAWFKTIDSERLKREVEEHGRAKVGHRGDLSSEPTEAPNGKDDPEYTHWVRLCALYAERFHRLAWFAEEDPDGDVSFWVRPLPAEAQSD
jgi:hypothetical protein